MKILIKLGSNKTNGFYNVDSEKEYTELQHGRLPHLVLSILSDLEKEFPYNSTGFCCKNFVSNRLLRSDIADELKFDDYGYQVSLNSLLKDFLNAGLVQGKVKQNDWARVKITDSGKKFLKYNIKEKCEK